MKPAVHRPDTASALGVVGVVLLWFTAALAFWFVCDDAYISFRYARNWASGHGLGFNPGETAPVEGYSNFLWMACAAACEWVGLAPAEVLPWVSLLAGAVLLFDVFVTLRDRHGAPAGVAWVGVVLLAASPGLVVWGTSGLETLPAAWLLWRVVDGYVASEVSGATRRTALAALALALIRTEGIGWVAVAAVLGAALRLVSRGRSGDGLGRLAASVSAVAALYAVYFGWRWTHFGTLLSNTATAKVEADPERLARGFDYVAGFALEALAYGPWLGAAALAVLLARGPSRVLALFALGVPLFAVLVGGDFMTMGRLLVPGLAFSAASVALVLARMPAGWLRGLSAALVLAVAALGTLPLADVQLVPDELRKPYRVRFNSPAWRTEWQQWNYMRSNAIAWDRLGRALAQATSPGESIVLGAIGAAAYPTALHVHDRYGLVSREVAERAGGSRRRQSPGHDKAVPTTFFLDQKPTYLSAELARGPGLRAAGAEVLGWKSAEVRNGWAPELRPVVVDDERSWLVLLTRHEDPAPVWEAFPAVLDAAVREARASKEP